MVSLHPDQDKIVRDPEWLPHRYDESGDRIHFIHASRETHRAATFLIDEYLPEVGQPRVLSRQDALALSPPIAPIHFIFHSAYCCSTLLARAFDIEGVAMGLKEPQILNDLHGWRSRGGAPARIAEVLDSSLSLLSRPFQRGEAIVVKPSNLVNPLAPAMLAMRPQAKALLLYAPLRLYLGSIAKKGMWGRLWVRELFVKLARDGMLDYGFSGEDIMRQTDLQIAAIGWLGQHRQFAALAARHPERVRTLDSERLVAEPAAALAALSDLFELAFDSEVAARGDAFTRHSKADAAFSRADREAEHRAAAATHAEEVDQVAIWAEAVAAAAAQSLHLPSPLLPG